MVARLFFIGSLLCGLPLPHESAFGQDHQSVNFVMAQLTARPVERFQEGLTPAHPPSEPVTMGKLLIRIYQQGLSCQDKPVCVFDVSCSRFALKAIQQKGLFVGTLLAADRLQRCNEYATPYYKFSDVSGKLCDPVLEYLENKR
jgi:putative component of membrane protein insertase Oxa1/YidC/SpoIIIJ protein YidD